METMDLLRQRHSVRRYLDKPLAEDVRDRLAAFVQQCSREAGLHIQLLCNEPAGFGRTFPCCANYLALIGPKGPELEERCGYYGEKIVLYAQSLGLNSCWAGLAPARRVRAYTLEDREAFVIGVALGYGADSGRERKCKAFEDVARFSGEIPDWFRSGVEAALLAPTAMNRQAFTLELREGDTVRLRYRPGPFYRVDLGIVKYHFEIGAGRENFRWDE